MAPNTPFLRDPETGEIVTDERGSPILRSTGKPIHRGYGGGMNIWDRGMTKEEMANPYGEKDLVTAEEPEGPTFEEFVAANPIDTGGTFEGEPGGLGLGVEGVGPVAGGFQPTEPTMPRLQLRPVKPLKETQEEARRAVRAQMSPADRAMYDFRVGSRQTEDNIRKSAEAQKAAIDQQAEIAVDKSDEISAAMGVADEEAKHRMRRAEAMEKAAAQSATKNLNDLKKRTEDYKNMRVDDDLWSRQGAGRSTAMLLGAIGGGWLEVMSGGRIKNKMLDIIKDAVNRDIALQEREIARAGTAIGLQQSIYALEAENWDTRIEREHAGRIRIYDALKRQIDTIGVKWAGPEAQANAEMLKARIDREQAGEIHKLYAARLGAEMGKLKLDEQIRMRKQAAWHQHKMRKLKSAQIQTSRPYVLIGRGATSGRFANQKEVTVGFLNPLVGDDVSRRNTYKRVRVRETLLTHGADLIRQLEEHKGFKTLPEFMESAEGQKIIGRYQGILADSVRLYSGAQASDMEVNRHKAIMGKLKDWKQFLRGQPLKTLKQWHSDNLHTHKQDVKDNFTGINPTYYEHMAEFYSPQMRAAEEPPDEVDKVIASGNPVAIAEEGADIISKTNNPNMKELKKKHGEFAKDFRRKRVDTWQDLQDMRGAIEKKIAGIKDPGPMPKPRAKTSGGKWAKQEWAKDVKNKRDAYRSYAKHLGRMVKFAKEKRLWDYLGGLNVEVLETAGGVSFVTREEKRNLGSGDSTPPQIIGLFGGQGAPPKWMSRKMVREIYGIYQTASETEGEKDTRRREDYGGTSMMGGSGR